MFNRSFIILIISIIGSSSIVLSQGFDWVYSWNSPFKSPRVFIGAYGGAGISKECNSPNTFSDVVSCCKLSEGSGTTFKTGITAEYWILGTYSLQATVGYGKETSNFHNERADSILVLENKRYVPKKMTRSFDLTYSGHSLDLGLIGKTRIASTHISIATGFTCSFPTIFSFETNVNTTYKVDGLNLDLEKSYPEQIPNDLIKRSAVLFKPMIRSEYDIALQKGIYLKPYLQADYTLNSRITDAPWNSWAVLCGISLLFGY